MLYDTYDITSMLKPGPNAAGLTLGNGMYKAEQGRYTKFTGSFGPQKAIAEIRLEYGDGTVDWVTTDQSWRYHSGPITYSHVSGGENYDARLAPVGWDRQGSKQRIGSPFTKHSDPAAHSMDHPPQAIRSA